MMSSKVRMATLSSVVRVFSDVVFIIPFRAATISGPFMKAGIPTLAALLADRIVNSSDRKLHLHRSRFPFLLIVPSVGWLI
jgi:hypothetical protein